MHQRMILLAALLTGLFGCQTTSDPDGNDFECRGGRCDSQNDGSSFAQRWAIDMEKVHNYYENSERFVAVNPTDLLPEPLASQACERETIINSDGTTQPGGCYLWGNMMRLNYDHTEHVDNPEESPIVNIIDGGQMIDPPGYLNIIAQLNAERHEQTEIRNYLRNGDILVYFHPDDTDTTQFRMHHAAMFYDTGEGPLAISLDGVPFVHHIDNPVSYGPTFNSGPTAPPFHVYRLNPNGAPNVGPRDDEGRYVFECTEEIRGAGGPAECQAGADTFTIDDNMAAQYAYIARNWAIILNDHAPFSNFHIMSWNDAADRAAVGNGILNEVDRYARPALERGRTPNVYCAGLVFTQLNLALNRPLNQNGLGEELYSIFSTNSFDFDDRYMQLGMGNGAAHTYLIDSDLEDTMNLPSIGRLIFEPIPASEIIDSWLEGYFGRLPREVRAQILAGAADLISNGFRNLIWAAGKIDEEAAGTVVATPQRIQQYAMAYAAGDADANTISVQGGELVVVPGPDGQPDLPQMKAIELQYVDNRYVPPPLYHVMANRPDSLISYVGTVIHVDLLAPIGDNEGEDTGTGGVAEFAEGGPDTSLYEHFYIENGGRHVQRIFNVSSGPALVGHGSSVSTRISAANINDVRVVLHPPMSFTPLDSLSACDHNANCIGDAPGIYLPLDASQNGGDTVWNDVNVSFDFFEPVSEGGLGCVMVGDIAGTWDEVVFTHGEVDAVLDIANSASFEQLDNDVALRSNAAQNIVDSRPIADMNALAAVPQVGGAALEALRSYVPTWTGSSESERYALCPAYDWATGGVDTTDRILVDTTHGQWTITTLDLGEIDDGVEVDNCAYCREGGAHSNQWFMVLRDEDGETVIEEPSTPVECDTASFDSREDAAASTEMLGVNATLEEMICSGDHDWFIVQAGEEVVTVEITFPVTADFDMEAIELDGTTLASSTGTDTIESIEALGTFLVHVYGYDDTDSGAYTLTVHPE